MFVCRELKQMEVVSYVSFFVVLLSWYPVWGSCSNFDRDINVGQQLL